MEGRYMATVDVPGAFLQAEQDEEVHVKRRNDMAPMLALIDTAK
jgi:hypothetical protein